MRVLFMVAALWFVSEVAEASCAWRGVEVLWTYPAHKERDVPTNAVFWVLATGGAVPTATLDGVPLTLGELGELRPGTLLPEHDYELRLKYPRADEWDPDVPTVIKFRTGKRAARTPSTLPPPRITRSKQVPAKLERLLSAHDCYDTMQNTLVSFHAAAPVVAYLVEGHLWPAVYGAPALFMRAGDAARVCASLVPIGKGGRPGRATRACARRTR